RRRDRPEPHRGEPGQRELGAVEELEDDRLSGPHAARGKLAREPLHVVPELRVGPAPFALRLSQRRPIGEAGGVAGDPGEVAEIALEDVAERGWVVLVQRAGSPRGELYSALACTPARTIRRHAVTILLTLVL